MTNLQHLAAADTIFADGTFYVVPKLFYQLYTFHARIDNKMYPLVYLLLPDKKTETYLRAFRLLKTTAANRGLQREPQHIQMDYEAAAKIAAANVFPTSTWKGCFFHYTQCVWRKTQQCGLQTDYNVDPEVTRLVRRCAALPMLPPDQVEDMVLQTIGDMPDDPRCTRLADYITNFWMEGDFPIASWNHHTTDGPRTNNHLEGWHGRLKKIVSKAHPNVFELLKFLQNEQKKIEITIVQIQAGHSLPPRKKRYTNMDRRITLLKERLASGQISPISFTDDISVLLKLA